MVGRLQKALVGSVESREGFSIDSFFRPREEAGGDLLAHYKLSVEEDLLLVTDVSGHQFDAAVMSSFFHGMARALIESGTPIEQVLDRYNRTLLTTPGFRAQPSSLAACTVRLDYKRSLMTICLAGSPAPVWMDADGWLETWTGGLSSPLGWFIDSSLAMGTWPAPSGPIWIWTDGVSDLAAQIGAHPLSVASVLIDSVKAGSEPDWLAGARDDVLAVRIWPPSATLPRTAYPRPVFADRYQQRHIRHIEALQSMWQRSLEIAIPQIDPEVASKVSHFSREALLDSLQQCRNEKEEVPFQIVLEAKTGEVALRFQTPDHVVSRMTWTSTLIPAH